MPGIKKNENANNPHANKYKVPGVSKSIANPFRKNPIPIPRNAKTSNKGFSNAEIKKLAT